MSFFQSFIDDKNPLAADQQAEFLQEGREEQARLQQENIELQARASQLLQHPKIIRLLRQFEDRSGRSEAELQVKYHQTLSDIDQARVDISSVQARAEQEQMVLRAAYEDAVQGCEDLLIQFQTLRDAAREIQVPAFGVQLSAQQLQQLENDFTTAFDVAEQERLDFIISQEKYKQLEKQVKKNVNQSDRNNIIDYEQLKIQNQSLAEKIEERSEELLKLRRKTVSTLQILAHVREKKHFVEAQVNDLQRQQTLLDNQIIEKRRELGDLKLEKNRIKVQMDQSREQTGLAGNDMLKKDYEARQNIVEGLHGEMATLKRRLEELTVHLDELKKRREFAMH